MEKLKLLIVCVSLFLVCSANAQEQLSGFELTPFGGFTFGGEFEDSTNDNRLELEDDASFGLIFNIRESANTQWEILYSRQSTEASNTDPMVVGPPMDLDVQYLHGGGTYLGAGDRARPYLAATVGATNFSPGVSDIDSETFFSFSIGTGLQVRPNDRLGIRLEARAFGTLLESDTDLFCRSGPMGATCAIRTEGTVLWQFQAFAGLVFRF